MDVLVVDDHALFASGLTRILETLEPALRCAIASNAEEAIALLGGSTQYEWVFLDLDLPGQSGLAVLDALREALDPVPVIILSASEDPASIDNALRRGATGYLPKSATPSQLKDAIESISSTGAYFDAEMREAVQRFRARQDVYLDNDRWRLSKRQRDVLELMGEGHSNKAIAERLFISESTVKSHVSMLLDVFDVQNRTGCVRAAREHGLL